MFSLFPPSKLKDAFLKESIIENSILLNFKYLQSNLILYFSPLIYFILHKIIEVENSILSIFIHKKLFTNKWINNFFLLPSRLQPNRIHTRSEHNWPEIDPNQNFTRSDIDPKFEPNFTRPKVDPTHTRPEPGYRSTTWINPNQTSTKPNPYPTRIWLIRNRPEPKLHPIRTRTRPEWT